MPTRGFECEDVPILHQAARVYVFGKSHHYTQLNYRPILRRRVVSSVDLLLSLLSYLLYRLLQGFCSRTFQVVTLAKEVPVLDKEHYEVLVLHEFRRRLGVVRRRHVLDVEVIDDGGGRLVVQRPVAVLPRLAPLARHRAPEVADGEVGLGGERDDELRGVRLTHVRQDAVALEAAIHPVVRRHGDDEQNGDVAGEDDRTELAQFIHAFRRMFETSCVLHCRYRPLRSTRRPGHVSELQTSHLYPVVILTFAYFPACVCAVDCRQYIVSIALCVTAFLSVSKCSSVISGRRRLLCS